MSILKMNKYGSVLTGREFGIDTMKTISSEIQHPVVLDFSGVNTLGSSFADEILIPIANGQNKKIDVCNVKTPVWDCIRDVTTDAGIEVTIIG
ncbi:MAG: DUF4325 domain-containing protein [Bdellovibrionota bacterium]